MNKLFFNMNKCTLFIALGLSITSCSDTPIDEAQQEPVKNDSNIEDIIDDEEGKEFKHIHVKHFEPIILNDVERLVNSQHTDFSVNFFKVAQKEMANKNFVISPYSVSTALSMLTNGAGGNTAVELQNVLLGEGATLDDLNDYNKRIASKIDTLDNLTQLEIANGIFPDKNISLLSHFIDNNKNFYDASVLPVNFNNLAECNPILNKWVDNATHGLIKNMSVSTYTPLLIANTLYFKSSWAQCFDKDYTKDASFYNYDNTVSTVKMMHGGNFDYNIDGDFAILRIPFGNQAFSMYIAYNYADQANSLNGIDGFLTKENIKENLYGRHSGPGSIKIPKFDVSISDINIDVLLQNIGITDLFGDKADLSNLFTDKENTLFKPSVFHECVLRVDETGTEGAAKTLLLLIGAPSLTLPEPKDFIVDHPFVFWIAEKSTGTLLFMGQINKLENTKE